MSTPICPSTVPIVSKFTLTPDSGLISDSGDGPKDFRRRYSCASAQASIAWNLQATELQILLTFGRTDLLQFHRWFWLKLPSAGGITWHVVRIAPGTKPRVRSTGHGAWSVEADIVIRERAFTEQPEPPVEPEPPTGEPDVLSFLLNGNSNTYPLDATRVALSDFSTRKALTAADYATFNETNGKLTLLQGGVYELLLSIATTSLTFFTQSANIGAEVSVFSEDDGPSGFGIAAYPFSFPLVSSAPVNAGGPSFPTVVLHKIINVYDYAPIHDPYEIIIEPFAYTAAETGTYYVLSISGSLRRLGDSIFTPSDD
jgi:hypothetical protein